MLGGSTNATQDSSIGDRFRFCSMLLYTGRNHMEAALGATKICISLLHYIQGRRLL
jgi:hypothetical protein